MVADAAMPARAANPRTGAASDRLAVKCSFPVQPGNAGGVGYAPQSADRLVGGGQAG